MPILACLPYRELSRTRLREIDPDIVFSPAVADRFDCFDLAGRLMQLGYDGKLLVICIGMPNPHIVLHELRECFPLLDCDLVFPHDTTGARLQ